MTFGILKGSGFVIWECQGSSAIEFAVSELTGILLINSLIIMLSFLQLSSSVFKSRKKESKVGRMTKRVDLGGMLRGQEKADEKEQNFLTCRYFVSSWQHAEPPVGKEIGNKWSSLANLSCLL